MPKQTKTSWGGVSRWYGDLVGEKGHYYHQNIILPKLLKLLSLKKGDSLIDLGCGEGVVERKIPENITYLGVDVSDQLLTLARKKVKSASHSFRQINLSRSTQLIQKFSKAICVLALQNMENGQECVKTAAKVLNKNGTFIIVLNHPCFRIPRQSSWGIDEKNKLQFRRINRYMSSLEIPIQMSPGREQQKVTWSYHHPISTYFQWLRTEGFVVEVCEEWVSDKESEGKAAKMENRGRAEIPLFLCLVARKL